MALAGSAVTAIQAASAPARRGATPLPHPPGCTPRALTGIPCSAACARPAGAVPARPGGHVRRTVPAAAERRDALGVQVDLDVAGAAWLMIWRAW
jgi:hypothetical protein